MTVITNTSFLLLYTTNRIRRPHQRPTKRRQSTITVLFTINRNLCNRFTPILAFNRTTPIKRHVIYFIAYEQIAETVTSTTTSESLFCQQKGTAGILFDRLRQTFLLTDINTLLRFSTRTFSAKRRDFEVRPRTVLQLQFDDFRNHGSTCTYTVVYKREIGTNYGL